MAAGMRTSLHDGRLPGDGGAAVAASRCCCRSLAVSRNSRLAPTPGTCICRAGSTVALGHPSVRAAAAACCRQPPAPMPAAAIGAARGPIRPHCDPRFSRRRSQATRGSVQRRALPHTPQWPRRWCSLRSACSACSDNTGSRSAQPPRRSGVEGWRWGFPRLLVFACWPAHLRHVTANNAP